MNNLHDDFCIVPDSSPDCVVCDLIRRVRKDEKENIENSETLDIDIERLRALSFEEGYKKGLNKETMPTHVSNEQMLDTMKKYILNKVSTMTLYEANILYDMYNHCGGK